MSRKKFVSNADASSGPLPASEWDTAWDTVWDAADPPPGPKRPRRRLPVGWLALLAAILMTGAGAAAYVAAAFHTADGVMRALGQRDMAALTPHLDMARVLTSLQLDLQTMHGPAATALHQTRYLDSLAQTTQTQLLVPDLLGLVVRTRILAPAMRSMMGDLDATSRRIVIDSVTAFHVPLGSDGNAPTGMTLCFIMENPAALDWRLVKIAWSELGGFCRNNS